MESNDSLNILKVSEADEEEKTFGDEFSLSFGQQLAILVSFWLLARVAECHGSRGYIRVKKWLNVEKLGNLGVKAYLSVFSV